VFGKIKIDASDKLYSEIIRFGKTHCERCYKPNKLQCAHIMGRAHKNTRWMIKPVKNAIALCMTCHSWFDSCKDDTPLFDLKAREYFKANKNAYTFLVEDVGYTWDDLMKLYILSHNTIKKLYPFEKEEIKRQLKEYFKKLKEQS
jgi:hypothetical protein